MTKHTADLYDKYSDKLQIVDPIFNSYGACKRFHGTIYTLKLFEDFLLVKQTLGEAGEGRVLVVDGGGSLRCALLGDRLAAMAVVNGWSGAVIYGCIRDCAEINELNLGVKAINTSPVRPAAEGLGQIQVPVHFAGVIFEPGHQLYADADGIVVSQQPLE